jgi:hypothetical protein
MNRMFQMSSVPGTVLAEPITPSGLGAGRAMAELGGMLAPSLDSRAGVCTCRALHSL